MEIKDILTHYTQMSPEDSILSEMSQLPKGKYCVIPFMGGPQNTHIFRYGK
jgi:hypothetical protein